MHGEGKIRKVGENPKGSKMATDTGSAPLAWPHFHGSSSLPLRAFRRERGSVRRPGVLLLVCETYNPTSKSNDEDFFSFDHRGADPVSARDWCQEPGVEWGIVVTVAFPLDGTKRPPVREAGSCSTEG